MWFEDRRHSDEMEYLLHIVIVACIYIVLAVSLDLLVGQAGLISIAQAAFYGIGAYTSALLAVNFGTPFLLNILIGMAAAAMLSLVVSLPAARLRRDYLAIATFGFQMIFFDVVNNWVSLTGGPLGVPRIPKPAFFWRGIPSSVGFTVLAIACAAVTVVIVKRIWSSPVRA